MGFSERLSIMPLEWILIMMSPSTGKLLVSINTDPSAGTKVLF